MIVSSGQQLLRDVGDMSTYISNCFIHLLPEVDVSASAVCWCQGGHLLPQNKLPPPVQNSIYGRLLSDTVAINNSTYECEESTTERFLARQARVIAHSHRIPYLAGQLIAFFFDRDSVSTVLRYIYD
jgi:hypothetical protein